jgi:predicted translin family RNA/ssDNA-binding protein
MSDNGNSAPSGNAKKQKMTSTKFNMSTLPQADADFAEMEKELRSFDEKREIVIKKSRDIQKAAKQAIYALHRNDMTKANELLKVCENQKELFELVKSDSELRYGSFANSLEEYAEAIIFREYLLKRDTITPLNKKGIPIELTTEEYLGGLMDSCGEVQRRAVICATRGEISEVERAREYVDYIMGRVMNFDFRNGALRKKSDTIKWTLKRLEEVLFDISVSGRLRDDNDQAPPPTSDVPNSGNNEE